MLLHLRKERENKMRVPYVLDKIHLIHFSSKNKHEIIGLRPWRMTNDSDIMKQIN